ncbi:MAG: hypothetical protein AAGH81_01915 [Bacteroidota bacterium]
MNRLIMIYGCALLSSSAIAAVDQGTWEVSPIKEALRHKEKFETLIANMDHTIVKTALFSNATDNEDEEASDLDISTIEFIEDEAIELGFDPYDYLPENFDPHTFYLDLARVAFIDEEDHGLGFDTAKYLPIGFDAYEESTDLTSIHFIEEEELTLGFDTGKYLPLGFSPYEPYFDINSIPYIEIDNLDDGFLILSEEDCKAEEPF